MNEAMPTEAQNQEPAPEAHNNTNLNWDPESQLEAWIEEYQRFATWVDYPEEPRHSIAIQVPGRAVGRDKRPVPADDVFKLAALGCKDIEIAEWFGIDSNTLRYNFSVELLKGRETLKHSLRRKQLEVALGGNPTMLIFLGKNLLGQSDSPLGSQEKTPLPWTDDTE
jgi:hypothetical protein